MTIERARYAAYLKSADDMREFEREVTPFALEILRARYPWLDGDRMTVRFDKLSFFVDDAHGHTYGCRAELLFDPLWKDVCVEALRQDRNRLQAIAELSERAERQRVEKTEREQLAALLKKYPDQQVADLKKKLDEALERVESYREQIRNIGERS